MTGGSSPRLSICIPTYNRASYIGATLESIRDQLTGDVEVVVADGASTDDTAQVVGAFVAHDGRFRYERLPCKSGVDRDINHAVELARGQYCWIFPDDDLLKPGAIASVLRRLDEAHALIVVNAEVKGPDLRERLQARFIDIAEDRRYAADEQDRLFLDAANYLSYVGGVVIRRECWINRDRETYFDSDFVHVGVIFQQRLPGTALLLADPLIEIRYGHGSWETRAFEIWTFKWPRLVWSFDGIPDNVKTRVCPRDGWRNGKRLLMLRAGGAYSLREYDRWIRPLDAPAVTKLRARVIAALPGQLLNALAMAYAWARPDRGATRFDLRRSPFYFLQRTRRRRDARIGDAMGT